MATLLKYIFLKRPILARNRPFLCAALLAVAFETWTFISAAFSGSGLPDGYPGSHLSTSINVA
jgi:hypothetical protein